MIDRMLRLVGTVGVAVIAVVVVGAALVAVVEDGTGGAGGARGGSGAATVRSLDDLAGSWTVAEDAGSPPAPVVAGSVVRLTFDDGAVYAETGCNRMRGGAEVRDGALVVVGPASTMMACDPPLMAQEQWVGEMLSSTPTAVVDGDVLTLSWPGGTLRLTRD